LRAFAEPVISALEFQTEIVTLLERLICADFLDELAVSRAAVIGNNNAIDRGVRRPDPFHANSNCHKLSLCLCGQFSGHRLVSRKRVAKLDVVQGHCKSPF
jgi:hypothetical protein